MMRLRESWVVSMTVGVGASLAATAAAVDDILAVGTAGDVFTIDSATGRGALLDGARHFTGLNSLARDAGGVMYSASGDSLIIIDEFTGSATLVATLSIDDVRGLAFAPDGSLYAIDDGGIAMPDRLYAIEPATGEATLIGATSHARIQGFAIDHAGRAFAWDTEDGLLSVSLQSGESTDVNGLSDGTRDIHSLTFSSSGELYGCRYLFFTIDASTGARSLIGSGGYADVRGMAFIGAANGRVLRISGRCPGALTARWSGAEPNRPLALILGAQRGDFVIPPGAPCAGTLLGVAGQVRLVDPPGVFSSGAGSGAITGVAGTSVCGRFLQFIEGGSCAASNVAPLPPR